MPRISPIDLTAIERAPISPAALTNGVREVLNNSMAARVKVESYNWETGEYRVVLQGTLDLQDMVRAQGHLISGWLPGWGVLYQPLGFVIFFIAGIAESKRVPFDLPEGESELVSGYFTEYSGVKFLMFFMTDFVEIVVVAGLVTTMFFGGWQVPYLMRDGFHFPWGATVWAPHAIVILLQLASFLIKVFFFCWVQVLIRWTLPRFRYDQLMNLGWKGLLPIALANVLATGTIVLALQG